MGQGQWLLYILATLCSSEFSNWFFFLWPFQDGGHVNLAGEIECGIYYVLCTYTYKRNLKLLTTFFLLMLMNFWLNLFFNIKMQLMLLSNLSCQPPISAEFSGSRGETVSSGLSITHQVSSPNFGFFTVFRNTLVRRLEQMHPWHPWIFLHIVLSHCHPWYKCIQKFRILCWVEICIWLWLCNVWSYFNSQLSVKLFHVV